jgi:formylmethanofuran dehydrogenase subunit E
MRTIECDVCGEPVSAADDEVQQTIDREAYDATDS